jgi:hypothetical protein
MVKNSREEKREKKRAKPNQQEKTAQCLAAY